MREGKLIRVTISEEQKVAYEPTDCLPLEPGDLFVWTFEGVPERTRPGIVFVGPPSAVNTPEARESGPFAELVYAGDEILVGRGDSRAPGPQIYNYRFELTDASGNKKRLAYVEGISEGGIEKQPPPIDDG